jgi:hypothetical protein
MQEGKVYRLRADKITTWTVPAFAKEHGWLWLCVSLATYDRWGRFKSVATGAETFLKAEYLIRDMSEGD